MHAGKKRFNGGRQMMNIHNGITKIIAFSIVILFLASTIPVIINVKADNNDEW